MYYLRIWKMELEQPLALTYILYLYKLHFKKVLRELRVLMLLKSGRVCCCQYQKLILVLVDFCYSILKLLCNILIFLFLSIFFDLIFLFLFFAFLLFLGWWRGMWLQLYFIRLTCFCHAVWLHLVPEPSMPFSASCEHVTLVTMSCDLWQCHTLSSSSNNKN